MILSISVLYAVVLKEYIGFCFKLTFSASKLSNQKSIRHIKDSSETFNVLSPDEGSHNSIWNTVFCTTEKRNWVYLCASPCVYIEIYVYRCFQNSQHYHIWCLPRWVARERTPSTPEQRETQHPGASILSGENHQMSWSAGSWASPVIKSFYSIGRKWEYIFFEIWLKT